MKKRKLRKGVVYSLYGMAFCFLMGFLFLIDSVNQEKIDDYDLKYVNGTIFDTYVPVIASTKIIIKPYVSDKVSIFINYYDYKSSEEDQQKSLIYYEGTYLQNSGIVYGSNEEFDVLSILEGTVIEVKEDSTLGKIIQIRHSNDVISIYQGVKDVNVKVNDNINQGQIIAKSGNCNMLKDLGNTVLFELIVNGNTVNPENYFNKNINELK